MRMRMSLVGRVAMSVCGVALVATAAMRAQAAIYPSVAPGCGTTLQACIDAAASGEIIEIATNTPIVESVTIEKSLTLRPAVGFSPSVRSVFVFASVSSADVLISNLTFTRGIRALLASGGANLTLTVRDNVIAGNENAAIGVADNPGPGTYGSLIAVIERNRISQTGDTRNCGDGISFTVASANAAAATIANNEITATNLDQCGGIRISASEIAGASVNVSRNMIRGSDFDYGIFVFGGGAATTIAAGLLDVTIVNNLVVGQNGNVGVSGGIAVSASGSNARIAAAVVNNTVVAGRDGVRVSARTDLGATLTGQIANNVVANHGQSGFSIDNALTTVTNFNNLIFGNANNFFTPGPGTRTGNPAFVNAAGGNYALSAASDAIDRGSDAAVPASFALDLPGNARRQGGAIDIGAYESTFNAAAATAQAVPTGGTSAWLLLLSGLAAIAVFATKARRSARTPD
jgi:hypothetical protein